MLHQNDSTQPCQHTLKCVLPLLVLVGCSGYSHTTDEIKKSLRELVPLRMSYETNHPKEVTDYHITRVSALNDGNFIVEGYWEIVAMRRAPDFNHRNRSSAKYREKQPFVVDATIDDSQTAF